MLLYGDRIDFTKALYRCDHRSVLAGLKKGSNVNLPGPLNVMDLFMVKNYTPGITAVLNNTEWNPNYVGRDGLSLIERAMLKGKEKFVFRVMQHPNFDPNARLGGGRTLAMAAVMFSAPQVFKATKNMTLPTDVDEFGNTLEKYLASFGAPRAGRLRAIQRNDLEYRKKLEQQMVMTRV